MKKLIFIALMIVSGYSAAYSQKEPIKYYSSELMEEIKATEVQKAAVKELASRYNVQFKALKGNTSLSAEEYETERRKISGERSKEYWKILSPEQTKYLMDKAKKNKNN